MSEHEAGGTRSSSYTARLTALAGSGWKQRLDVQAPYRWNLHRLLGGRKVLDVGCGIGRNLKNLDPSSVGVDHNEHSVEACRSSGLNAYTSEEFWASDYAVPERFDGLLAAHLVEHLPREEAAGVLAPYLRLLRPSSPVVIICPQERGYRSDSTHVHFFDHAELRTLVEEIELDLDRQFSFPLPRAAGRLFTYNEFVTVARR